MKATLRLTIIAGVCITSTGFLICELFPHAISAIFTSDEELIDIASRGVRIAVAIFPLVGAQIVIGNFFQSIGKAKISIFLSLTRQLLYLLPGLTDNSRITLGWTASGYVCRYRTSLLCNGSGGIVDICKKITQQELPKKRGESEFILLQILHFML